MTAGLRNYYLGLHPPSCQLAAIGFSNKDRSWAAEEEEKEGGGEKSIAGWCAHHASAAEQRPCLAILLDRKTKSLRRTVTKGFTIGGKVPPRRAFAEQRK